MWNSAEVIAEMPKAGSIPVDASHFLDLEDINGPGNAEIPQVSGDTETDFALYKISKYASSEDSEQRCLFVSNIAETARDLGRQAFDLIFPILIGLFDDEPKLRLATLDHLPDLLRVMMELDTRSYNTVLQDILPLVKTLMLDPEYREASCSALGRITGLLSQEDRGIHVLTFVLTVVHDDDSQELKLAAVELLNALAGDFGIDLCEQFLTPEILCMADDPTSDVRSAIAKNIAQIASTVSPTTLTGKLLPIYIKLCSDEEDTVRLACIESLAGIVGATADTTLVSHLTERLIKFTHDDSPSVAETACRTIGPFAVAIHASFGTIDEAVISYFIDMATTGVIKRKWKNQPIYYCAYNFPALLSVVSTNIQVTLLYLYRQISRDYHMNVRKSLANSVGDVAGIVGQEATENVLMEVYEQFLRDEPEVQTGAIANLSRFLQILSQASRERFIPVIQLLQARKDNWRTRELLASQIPAIVELYPSSQLYGMILPIITALMSDVVQLVRCSAASGFGNAFVKLIDASDQAKDTMTRLLKAYSGHPKFTQRQLYPRIACRIAQVDWPMFEEHCWFDLIHLVSDPVVNVRVALAKAMATCEVVRIYPPIQRIVLALRQDMEADVRQTAQLISLPSFGPKLSAPCHCEIDAHESDDVTVVLEVTDDAETAALGLLQDASRLELDNLTAFPASVNLAIDQVLSTTDLPGLVEAYLV